jgi:hypothetical protein
MQDMDGFKLPAGDPKRSASNLMFYTAIVGKSPTIERPSAPPPPAWGSMRWFTGHCRQAGHAMGGSLRHTWGRVRKFDVTAISPAGMSNWLVKECRAAKIVTERSIHAGVKRFSRAH